MTTTEKNIRVRFNGRVLWWHRCKDNSGALAPLDHCDVHGNVIVLGESYAHVMEDGRIMRYREQIGVRDDLEECSDLTHH